MSASFPLILDSAHEAPKAGKIFGLLIRIFARGQLSPLPLPSFSCLSSLPSQFSVIEREQRGYKNAQSTPAAIIATAFAGFTLCSCRITPINRSKKRKLKKKNTMPSFHPSPFSVLCFLHLPGPEALTTQLWSPSDFPASLHPVLPSQPCSAT